ncbi:TetR/AcrR family transcriptional regulator [Aeromicrobium sp. Leaf350]|uniref:TetR/AcrR family transcriptional regulator n=1 Tax=Aeromicrobium sp. Leaf350 TaxID=2876565 RepID=UPI001E4BDB01|nr:TetR/AcrR family transcriptional regulator [Aeromicrobium sp. Leaf350]
MTDAPTLQNSAGRPRSGRLPRSARKAQLLEVALAVFVEQGYHAASMDEIAERAGVSKPVLYQHFPGKLDLYLALIQSACDTVIGAVREALASTQDNRRRVRATIELWFEYVARDDAPVRLVFESDLTSDPEVRDQLDRVTTESASAVAEVISEDTGLPQEAAHLLAVALVSMGQVSARHWLDSQSTVSREDATRMLATLAWRGIGGFPKDEAPTP